MKSMSDNNFKKISGQQGWTFWSLLFVMLIVLFFSYVGMKLVPIYTANSNVQNAMRGALEGVDLRKMNRTQVQRKIDAQLYLDGSHRVLNYSEDLKVKRTRKAFIVETHYTREIPLFFNLSLVAKFDNVEERSLNQSTPSN